MCQRFLFGLSSFITENKLDWEAYNTLYLMVASPERNMTPCTDGGTVSLNTFNVALATSSNDTAKGFVFVNPRPGMTQLGLRMIPSRSTLCS